MVGSQLLCDASVLERDSQYLFDLFPETSSGRQTGQCECGFGRQKTDGKETGADASIRGGIHPPFSSPTLCSSVWALSVW